VLGLQDYALLSMTTTLECLWSAFYATGEHRFLQRIMAMGLYWAEFSDLPNAVQYLSSIQTPLPAEFNVRAHRVRAHRGGGEQAASGRRAGRTAIRSSCTLAVRRSKRSGPRALCATRGRTHLAPLSGRCYRTPGGTKVRSRTQSRDARFTGRSSQRVLSALMLALVSATPAAVTSVVAAECGKLAEYCVDPELRGKASGGGDADGGSARPLLTSDEVNMRLEMYPSLMHLIARSVLDVPFSVSPGTAATSRAGAPPTPA